jgi:hypothetical protein
VTQDQFRLVSEKVSDILEYNYTINIKLFQLNFTCVELLRYKHIPHVEILDENRRTSPIDCSFQNVKLFDKVSKGAPPGGEPAFLDSLSDTLPQRHTYILIPHSKLICKTGAGSNMHFKLLPCPQETVLQSKCKKEKGLAFLNHINLFISVLYNI